MGKILITMKSTRFTRLAAWIIVILIPIRILGLGFMPVDDVLRHAGKAMTERTWPEILVLRPEATEDSHPGWHWILGRAHSLLGAEGIDLVFLSVAGLFILIAGTGLARSNPTAWMLTMLIAYVTASADIGRWSTGRPYLVSSTVALFLAQRWLRDGPHGWKDWPFLLGLFSVVAWIHPSFYLFAIPVVALLLAREIRAAIVLGSAVAAGAIVAGGLTGHPIQYLVQSVMHPLWSLSWPNATLAVEFQPFNGAPMFMVALLSIVAIGSRSVTYPVCPPLLAFMGLGWSLGFVSGRFWADWGFPAAVVWLAGFLEEWIERSDTGQSIQRMGVAVAGVVFLTATADTGGCWSSASVSPYRALATDANAGLLPDRGGILYSDDMRVFYEVFFRKPDAPFRYVLGFEPGLMQTEDQAVLRSAIQTGLINPMDAWVAKMTGRDRLILRSAGGVPDLAMLDWARISSDVWVGRKVDSKVDR